MSNQNSNDSIKFPPLADDSQSQSTQSIPESSASSGSTGSSNTETSSSYEESSDSDFSAEIEIPFSISGIQAKTLTEKESMTLSSKLRMKHRSLNQNAKELFYAGVAPSRFNLSKVSAGKYVTRMFRHHKWTTQRSKYLWQQLRKQVLGSKAPDDDDEEEEDLNYQLHLSQGFKLQTVFKRANEITALVYNPKIPPHLLDGSLGHDVETEVVDSSTINNENEDEEDFFSEPTISKRNPIQTFILIDSKKILSMWDTNQNVPANTLKLEKDMTHVIFIPRYCLYAGLVEQSTIRFFTSKLEFTSSVKASFPIDSMLYEPKTNELIGVGTHKVIVWNLDSTYIQGSVCISGTVKMIIEPEKNPNQWISWCCSVPRMRQLWVVVYNNIFIYNLETGECVSVLKEVIERRITCLASHDTHSYMLLGSIDGTVKVLNIINATVHDFVAHSRPVVSIAVFSGPLFVTCGQDNTLRLFNLKYFREICSVHLKEKPLAMNLIDDGTMYIRTRSSTEIWSTNQFNINYATLSSNISHLIYMNATETKQAKIFARTEDSVVRLLNPVTGRTIAANLPPVENEVVLDVAYYLRIERMFVLLENGFIWVFRTDQNPCTIVDVWNSIEARNEFCTHLTICHGQFEEDDSKLCPPSLKTFGFLLAGTKNGHVVVFGRGGTILDRYQLHMGEITHIQYQEEGHVLLSTGIDTRIRLSVIKPFDPNMIQIQIDIITNYIPQAISILGHVLCVATDDGGIQMFETNIPKQEWRIMKGHQKGHDHTQKVTSITHCPVNRVFLSIGNDGSLRVWSNQNALLREIQFQEPLSGLCLANEKGDVLVGIGNRIDMIKSSLYLPQSYLRNRPNYKKPPSEKPLVFDGTLVPFTRPPKVLHRNREKILVDKSNPFEVFCEANLEWIERSSNIRRRPIWDFKENIEYGFGNAGDVLDRFLREIESKKAELKRRRKAIVVQKLKEDAEKQYEMRKSTVQNQAEFKKKIKAKLIKLIGEEEISPEAIDEAVELQFLKSFVLAKDVYQPNSVMGKELRKHKWKKVKGFVAIRGALGDKKKKPLKKKKKRFDSNFNLVEVSDDDLSNTDDITKSKLHNKMKKMVDSENAKKQDEGSANCLPEEEQEPAPMLKLGKQDLNESDMALDEIDRPKKKNDFIDLVLPMTIERFMNYDWFPTDQVFHEEGWKESPNTVIFVTNSRGKEFSRVPKLNGDPNDMVPVILGCLDQVQPSQKTEVLAFLKWILSEHGYQESDGYIADFFSSYLERKITDTDDLRIHLQILDMFVDLPSRSKEMLLVLLPLCNSMYNTLREKTIQVLRSMGATCIEDPFIMRLLDKLPEMVEKAKSEFGVTYGDVAEKRDTSLKGITIEFLQTALHRFLIKGSRSIDTSKVVQILDIYGKEDKGKLELRISKQKKKNKTPQAREDPDVSIYDRRLSLVNPVEFENTSRKIRQGVLNLRDREFPTSLDTKEYPALPIKVPLPLDEPDHIRTPIEILKTPEVEDYIDAINFLYLEEEERLAEVERKRLLEEETQMRARMLLLAEQQRKADEMNAQKKMYAERLAAEMARKERIRLLLLARQGAPMVDTATEKKKTRKNFSEMQTLGIGRTHTSNCHHSREAVDVLFKVQPKDSQYNGFINSSLTVHFKTQNKAMPIEQVQLQPFNLSAEDGPSRPKTTGGLSSRSSRNGRMNDTTSSSRPKTAANTSSDVEFIREGVHFPDPSPKPTTAPESKSEFKRYLSEKELEKKREAQFQPTRRYFMPSLFQ